MLPGYHPAADWSNDRRSSSTHLREGNTGRCSNRWPSDSPAVVANPDAHLTQQVAVPSLASKENCIANPQAKRPGKYGFGARSLDLRRPVCGTFLLNWFRVPDCGCV